MSTMADRAVKDFLLDKGYRPGSSLENRVMLIFHRWDVSEYQREHRVGRYRIDFAWPDVKVALEADGWHHGNPDSALRDSRRDRDLRREGWLIFRVDDDMWEDAPHDLQDQLLRVVMFVRYVQSEKL